MSVADVENGEAPSGIRAIWRTFRRDRLATLGLVGAGFLVAMALYAPFIANNRPFLTIMKSGAWGSPFFRYLFAPDSPEIVIEKLFNYAALCLPFVMIVWLAFGRARRGVRNAIWLIGALGLAIPFFAYQTRLDKTNWRARPDVAFAIRAPIPYGPFETAGKPYETSNATHWLGTDHIGRDVASRIVYGSRVAIAIGFLATALSLVLGAAVGLVAGYFAGVVDLVIMRVVEIVICFPSFLLLLILMAILMDYKFEQSALVVVPVIGLLGWTGLSRIVRGETLKQRAMPYALSCEAAGLPKWRILFIHLLPNVSSPIFVSAVFMTAANVLAESGLSFLGFGVQPPTASWGELLRQAFADPLRYWNLTLWPGLLIFITVTSFNLMGEGLRKALDPRRAE